jgi:hypothetical protein
MPNGCCALCQLVRDLPAFDERRRNAPRHLRRCHRQTAAHPRHGFRRAVLPADPPDRRGEPQGPQQHAHAAARRRGQPLRDRRGKEGGHDAFHPELGTSTISSRCSPPRACTVWRSRSTSPIQCSPDHPWLKEHPTWFAWRPDGTLRYAENPPKKYQDIVNPSISTRTMQARLWLALRDVSCSGSSRA